MSTRKQCFGSEPGFPISMAVRAGDFVFTSAQGDHGFDPAKVVYDENGLVVSDGNDLPPRTVADETRHTLRLVEATLRGSRMHARRRGRCLGVAARPARLSPDERGLCRVLPRELPDTLDLPHRFHVRLPRRDKGHGLQAAVRLVRSQLRPARATAPPHCGLSATVLPRPAVSAHGLVLFDAHSWSARRLVVGRRQPSESPSVELDRGMPLENQGKAGSAKRSQPLLKIAAK